jgi:hypothetical protein
MAGPKSTYVSNAFEKVLRGLLRPLVKALIAQGIAAPSFYRIIKKTYVDVADEMLGDASTDSRISVITGVHRRDVKAMRGQDAEAALDLKKRVSTLTSVIGRWLADPDTTHENGAPVALKRSGNAPSFETLVQSVSRDIRARTVLDELTRQGIATFDGEIVQLQLDALVGPADHDQKVHFFSQNVGDHLSAAVENLLSDTPRFMERAVYYNNLTASSVEDIEAQSRALGNDMLLAVNKKASTLQERDEGAADATRRFRLGVFFYEEDEA